jgi:hypothetical protein
MAFDAEMRIPQEEEKMPEINVESIVGLKKNMKTKITGNETVGELLKDIATAQAHDPTQTVLTYNGETMDENKKVKAYGLKDDDTVQIAPKYRKGGC